MVQNQNELRPFQVLVFLPFIALAAMSLRHEVRVALDSSAKRTRSAMRTLATLLGRVLLLTGIVIFGWAAAYSGQEQAYRLGKYIFLSGLVLSVDRSLIEGVQALLRRPS